MSVFVDGSHYKTHKDCSHGFNVLEYPLRHTNSQLQEQKNSRIKHLKAHSVHMNQFTFLFLLRYVLYRLNRKQKVETAKAVGGVERMLGKSIL